MVSMEAVVRSIVCNEFHGSNSSMSVMISMNSLSKIIMSSMVVVRRSHKIVEMNVIEVSRMDTMLNC